jgi:8-oxo-dGTP pyrophosphatase MutT (NUDIX family)
VVVPREAATVILLRGGLQTLEILLVRRTPQARFMAGAWVFPGGGVERGDGEGETALRAAAVRELREEAGISLPDPDALVAYSRWITVAASRGTVSVSGSGSISNIGRGSLTRSTLTHRHV